MKKFLSLLISYIMLFNLTVPVFAQSNLGLGNNKNNYGLGSKKLEQNMEKMRREAQQMKDYTNNLAINGGNSTAAKAKATATMVQRDIDNRIIESVPQKDRIVANMLGASYYAFKEQLSAYPDADLAASWKDYVKSLADYNAEYIVLTRKFDMENPPYEDIRSEISGALSSKKEKVAYDGKEYSIDAFLHAAIHNLVTRKGTGRMEKGFWVFSEEKEGEFSIEDKLTTMPYIYNIVAQYGYYPKDREYIWAFAYDIVVNGKKYFDNDTYKADLLPNIVSNAAKDERDRGKEARSRQASAVATAMAILPILTVNAEEARRASEAIYNLMNDVLGIISTYDYASVAIVTGASSLIALNSEGSLSTLMTFIIDDCKKGKVKGFFDFVMGVFSAEEWVKGVSRIVDKDGGYSYHNTLSSVFSYIDKGKTPFNESWLAGNSGGAEEYYNVIFTDIFEEIGRELGSNSSSKVVQSYMNVFANRLSNKGFNRNFSDDDVTISIVVGMLETAPKGDTSLRYAADLIYNGSWWDLNEATQRDKNNIAAAYLGKPKKEYNQEKDETFKKVFKAKYASTYADMVINAAMVASLIYSAPAIIKGFASWAGKSINNIRNTAGKIKNVKLSTSSRVGVKPATTREAVSMTRRGGTATTRTATTSVNTGKVANTASKTAARTAETTSSAERVSTAANATQTTKTATQTAEELRAAQIAQTQKDTQQSLERLEEALFGKRGHVAAVQVVPGVPAGVMDVMTGNATIGQLFNRSPKIRSLFDTSLKNTMKAIETKGLSVEEAKAFFVKDLSGRLDLTAFIPEARKASVIEEAAKSLDVAFERVGVATKSKSAITPIWNNKGFSPEEIQAISTISQDIGIEATNFLVETGLSPKEISYLNSRYPNSIRNNFSRTKKFFSEGGSFSDLQAILEGKPTFGELMNSMNPGSSSRIYTDAEKAYFRGVGEGSSASVAKASPVNTSAKSATAAKPAAPAKALSMEEKKAAIQKIGKGNSVARLEARGLLDDAYFSQTETLAKRGFKDDLIKELKDKGLLEAGNFQKVENMLDLGVNPNRIPRMKGYGFFDEPLYSRYTEIAKQVSAKGGDIERITKTLLSDANYPKTKALLDKGVDIKDIFRFNEEGILEAKYAELTKSAGAATQGAQTASGAGGRMTTAQKVQYLESKGLSGGQISFYEKNILNNEQYFQRAKTLIDKGFDPMEVAANRTTILEGSNFERVQKLSSSEFNKLANEGLFANSNYAVTEKLLEKGYKADDIIKFSKSKSFAGVSPESYVSNLERQATGQNFLAQKGWFEMDAFTLERAGFGTEKSYAKIESILSKGVSRQDVLALVDEGLLEEEYFAKVSTLLDYKISPSDIKMLRNNGALQKEYSTLQYLLQHKGNAQTITMLNDAGLLDDFAITKTWLQKGFKFNEMKTLHAIRADFYTTDIAAQVDFLVEKGFSPSQIENLYRANKLNNNLNRIQTLLDRGADYNALMKYLD